jgi:hypothetical protein
VKKLLIILASGTVAILALFAILFWFSWQPQSWYAPPNYSNSEVKTLADRAEYRLNEEFHKIRSAEEVWRLRITDEAMNAWLSGRLEGWLTHDQEIELPPEINQPQVHVKPDGIWFAAMVHIDGSDLRPVAIQLWVSVDNGMVAIDPVAIRIGKVPIPVAFFAEIAQEMQLKAEGIEPIVPLMDDREVAIESIVLEESALVLTCRTLLPR